MGPRRTVTDEWGRVVDLRLVDLAVATAQVAALPAGVERQSVTVAREAGMRLVLLKLRGGSALEDHAAPGAMTIHVLAGAVRFIVGGAALEAPAGKVLLLEAGALHAVEAEADSILLLTIADGGRPALVEG